MYIASSQVTREKSRKTIIHNIPNKLGSKKETVSLPMSATKKCHHYCCDLIFFCFQCTEKCTVTEKDSDFF